MTPAEVQVTYTQILMNEAKAWARKRSSARLEDDLEAREWEITAETLLEPISKDLVQSDADLAYARLKRTCEIAAIQNELKIRAEIPDQTHFQHSSAVSRLRHEIVDRISVQTLLEREGIAISRQLRNGQANSACPVCGGSDRFVIWPPTNGSRSRGWCRSCSLSGDVINIARQIWGTDYIDTISRLSADYLGLGGAA